MKFGTDLVNQANPPSTATLTKPGETSESQPDDLSSQFNVLIAQTTAAYNEYTTNLSVKPTTANNNTAKKPRRQSSDNNNKENDISMISLDKSNDLVDSFEEFNSVFSKLLTKIRTAKVSEHFQFIAVLRQTNINSLYEFAATLLQSHGSCQVSNDEHSEQKTVILKRTIELLHMLVTSKKLACLICILKHLKQPALIFLTEIRN